MNIYRIVSCITVLLMMAIIIRPSAARQLDSTRAVQAAANGIGGDAVICDNIGPRLNFCLTSACLDRGCATATTTLEVDSAGVLDCGDLEAEFCNIYKDMCCPECSLITSVYVNCLVFSSIENQCPGTDCGGSAGDDISLDMTTDDMFGNETKGIKDGQTRSSNSSDTEIDGAGNISDSDFGSNDLSCDHELSGCLMEHCLDETTTCLDPYSLIEMGNFDAESCDDSEWQFCDMAHQAISSVDQCCPECTEVTRSYFSCLLENTVFLNSSFCPVAACEDRSGGDKSGGGASVFVATGLLAVFFSINGGAKSSNSAVGLGLLILGASASFVSGAGLI